MTNLCVWMRKVGGAPSFLLLAVFALLAGCNTVEEKGEGTLQATIRDSGISGHVEPAPQPLPELDENATIHNYLTYALAHNPGLKSAFDRWRAALEKVPQAKSLPDPSLSYGYFIENIETRVGPQRHRLELMQKFPFFGKLGLRGEMALAAAKTSRATYEQERLNLLYRVKEAYYEYYYLGRAIELTEENVRLIERLEEVASARFRAGGAQQDVLKAQVELGKLRDRLASLRDRRSALAAKLNAELNRPVNAPLPWPKDVNEKKMRFTEEQLLQLATTRNWELKALSFDVERGEKMVALARKEFWPDFGVGVNYIVTGEPRAGDMVPADAGKDAVAAMVSVNLPLWRERLHAGVRESRAMLAAALEASQQKENALLSRLKFALYNYNDAVRQIHLYGETLIPKAEQALNASEAGYRGGKVDFVNIMDGERDLLAFRLAYERALADHEQRIAELEMLVDTPVTESVPQREEPAADKAANQPEQRPDQ